MALGPSTYRLTFDTQGLESVTASRRELALRKRIIEETTPVIDKLAAAEANIDRLHKKDLITLEQKNAALSKVKGEFSDTAKSASGFSTELLNGVPVVGKMTSMLTALGPAGTAVALGLAGGAVAAKLLSTAIQTTVDKVSEQIQKYDELSNAAETIGISTDQFQRLSHAADLADISQSQFASGTEKMLIGISKTADGTNKKLLPAFELLRLDARRLHEMEPDRAFTEITRALDRVPNSADKARAATAIFGSADFLRIDTSHIDRANSLMDRLRANLDKTDPAAFDEFDANVKDMNLALDETWKKLAMEVVPPLGQAAKIATEWLVKLNQNETFTDTLTTIGNALTVIVAVGREVPGVVDAWMPPLEKVANAIKAANPKLGIAMEVTGNVGAVIKDATSQIIEEEQRRKKLEAGLAAVQDSGESARDHGDEDPIKQETKAIKDLLEKLKEEVATKDKSVAMAKVWKLEQLKASQDVLAESRKLAEEYDALTKSEKAAKAVQTFTESLRHQGESAADSARRLADLKLQNDGVDAATRKSLMAQFDASEAQKLKIENDKKAAATAKQHADAVATLGDNIQKQTAKLQGYNAATGNHEQRTRAAERAVLEWQLAHDKAEQSVRVATLSHFDAATALEKRQKATEAALNAEMELQKLIRQAGMTAPEKQLDDLRIAGVNDEQLKILDTLQKEAILRGAIRQEITATSSAIKAGSREAADAFAKANQLAVREHFLRNRPLPEKQIAQNSPLPEKKVLPQSEPATFTVTAIPPEPVLTEPKTIPISVSSEPNLARRISESEAEDIWTSKPVGMTASVPPEPVPTEPVLPPASPRKDAATLMTRIVPPEPTPTEPKTIPISVNAGPNIARRISDAEAENIWTAKPVGMTATAMPPEPVPTEPVNARTLAATEARRRLQEQLTEKRTTDAAAAAEAKMKLTEQLTAKRAADAERAASVKDELARRLETKRESDRELAVAAKSRLDGLLGNVPAPKPMIAQQPSQNQERLIAETNTLLRQLISQAGMKPTEVTDPTL